MSLSEQIVASAKWKDVDIVLKYKKYPEFKKELDKIEKQYLYDLNMSLYSNLEHLQKSSPLQIVNSRNPKSNVRFYLNFYAYKVDFPEEEQEKFYLLLIRILDQKLRQNSEWKYSIIYYHCMSESTFPFSFLNETFKKLPIFYYAMLDKIYVVEPNFLVKNAVGMFDFGRLHKLFTKRIAYIDSLYELGKIQEIAKSDVLDSLPEVLKQQKALKQEKKNSKQMALQNIQNKGQKKSQQNLEQLPILKAVKKQDFLTIPLQNHKLSAEGLPIPLLILLQTLKSHPQFLNLEGIFRKSGSIEQQEEIINELSKMPNIGVLKNIDEYSGYAIAGVVKKFFTKLSIPIISYQIYHDIMQTNVEEGKETQFVKLIMSKLPALNKRVLMHLIVFLKDHVISKKQHNKMNNYNMSVCFCPCIFRAQKATLEDLMNSGRYAKILDILITKFQDVFAKDEVKMYVGKENRGSKGSRGSRNSKENPKSVGGESPTKILI